jgi:malate synthase
LNVFQVAHPGLIPFARKAFDAHMKGKNQISFIPQYSKPITSDDLLTIGNNGLKTRKGLRLNLDVALRYIEV